MIRSFCSVVHQPATRRAGDQFDPLIVVRHKHVLEDSLKPPALRRLSGRNGGQFNTNGWKYTFAGGRAGYDPGLRAALAEYEVGAQLSDQVIYPNTSVDDKGDALTGAHKYVLHFDAAKLPPVSVFWNMAMYGSDMLFVENDFGRYSIGSTTDGLKPNADGSLDILIQNQRPADTSNWLPAPEGDFNLTMRLYGPDDAGAGWFVSAAGSEADGLV